MKLRSIAKAPAVSLALIAMILLGAPAQADRWEKFPGKGNRKNWEKSWDIVVKKAYPMTEKGQWKEAMPLLDRAIKIYPDDSFYHFLMAMGHCNTGNKEAAIPEFEKAMELDPSDDHVPYYLGQLYDEKKDYKKSKALYKKAVDASKANPDNWLAYGLATYEVDGPKKALQVYQQAVKICPNEKILYHQMGCIEYLNNKNLKAAEAHFRKAISIDPKFYVSKSGLGEVLLKQNKWKESLKVCQEALKLPEAKDPKLSAELNGYIKECKKKLAPKPKKKKKIIKKAAPAANSGAAPSAAPAAPTAAPAAPAQ